MAFYAIFNGEKGLGVWVANDAETAISRALSDLSLEANPDGRIEAVEIISRNIVTFLEWIEARSFKSETRFNARMAEMGIRSPQKDNGVI